MKINRCKTKCMEKLENINIRMENEQIEQVNML